MSALCYSLSFLQNKVYRYPDTWVCLYNTYGCDEMEREERCMNSSTQTDGGNTTAVFFPGGEYEQEISAVEKLTKSVSTPTHLDPRVLILI